MATFVVAAAATAIACAGTDPYRAAMSEGRGLEEKGDHAGAIRAFREALAARPDDATALLELGWAAFHAHDLEQARSSTEKAVSAAKEEQLQGAALYNLGRIAEERGVKAAAIDAYKKSLAVRENDTVKARLATLERPARDPLAQRTTSGPFATLDEWCKKQKCIALDEEAPGKAALARPAPPWLGARLLSTGRYDDKSAHLALQTPSGWWVTAPLSEDSSPIVAPVEIALQARTGGASLMTARFITTWAYADSPTALRWILHCTETLVVCGVGPSGVPSCTPGIAVRDGQCPGERLDLAHIEWDWSLDVDLHAGASLELRARRKTKIPDGAKKALGLHPLAFP